MSATIDVLGPPKRILMVASNPSVSEQTGWPIGFWWAELTHPYWEFTEAGYEVTIASPDGGALAADSFSDPADPSGYSAHDLISRGFIASEEHRALVEHTPALADLDTNRFDAVFLVGGQAPMYTFRSDARVKDLVGRFVADGRVAAVVCHATCVLLDAATPTGDLVVAGRTWTGPLCVTMTRQTGRCRSAARAVPHPAARRCLRRRPVPPPASRVCFPTCEYSLPAAPGHAGRGRSDWRDA